MEVKNVINNTIIEGEIRLGKIKTCISYLIHPDMTLISKTDCFGRTWYLVI